MSGATRGSPRSARETVDWLILQLARYVLARHGHAGSIADGTRRDLTRSVPEVYAYVVNPRGRQVVETLKKPSRKQERAENDEAVAAVVDEIVSAVAADGDAAVRRYSARLDGWEPEALPAHCRRDRGEPRAGPDPGARRHRFRPGAGADVRPRAARDDDGPRGRDASGRPAGPPAHPDRGASAPTCRAAGTRWSPPPT